MKIQFKSLAILFILLTQSCQTEQSAGISCGGAMNSACPINSFCQLGKDCGGIDKIGVCKWIPENCPSSEETICGCDGREYMNECTANVLSVSKKNDGSCIAPPSIEVTSE